MPFELASSLTPTESDRLLQAEALVRGFCGWHIATPVTETKTLMGTGGWALTLPSLHVTAIGSIVSDGTALTVDDYDWTPEGIIYRRGCQWTGRTIVVTFTHGYDDPPAEVTAIVQALAQRAVQNPGSGVRRQVGPFLDQFSLTGSGESAAMALLEGEKATLRRYRIPAAS